MQVELITPENVAYSAKAEMISIPGTLGDFGVLPGHAPFISTIRPGIITIEAEDGKQHRVAVIAGLAEVVPDRCTVLAEDALSCEGVSVSDAESHIEQAKHDIGVADSDAERALAEKRLQLAEVLKSAVA